MTLDNGLLHKLGLFKNLLGTMYRTRGYDLNFEGDGDTQPKPMP